MLKINLLPSQRRDTGSAAADSVRTFGIAMAAALVVVVAGLFLHYSSKAREVSALAALNSVQDATVRQIRARISDHARVQADLEEIRAREQAISHLEGARTGPTSMLVELSHLLSPGGHPSSDPTVLDRIQRDSPTQMYNTTWDPHRLWIRLFTEDQRAVTIEGDGRTPDDVGEFMRRMMLSQYFEQVRLERSEGGDDSNTRISVQRFRIAARVRY
ncbi:MAG: PilN domain-containing protein [Deltaproteobacteria bacterium]